MKNKQDKIFQLAKYPNIINKTTTTTSSNSLKLNLFNIENESLTSLGSIQQKDLKFEVESWSSYISNFHPKNICLDSKASGQLSKWSVDFKSQNEFVFLKLEKTSIIQIITFGKFRDPTNLKEFKVYAGMDKNDMIEILHNGLTADMEYEPFSVKKIYKDHLIPCKYFLINMVSFCFNK